MRLRRLLTYAAGGLAATAGVNRALTARAGDRPPALEGDQCDYRWRGFDVAYTEAGTPDDPDVLLLHGIHAAASSHEFANVFDRLAEGYHVIAPDLPGFGRSDRPAVGYTAALYEAFVRDFARDRTENAVCVASSLSGAYAALAAEDAGFDRLVLVCPTADTAVKRPWLRTLLRSPVVGTALFNVLVAKPSLEYFDQRDAYYHPQNIDRETVDYQWWTSHQRNARFAPASFVAGYLDPVVDLGSQLADTTAPVTLVWGRESKIEPLAQGRRLADEADTRLVVLDEARLLPHAEHPETFLDVVAGDLPRLEDD